MQEFQIKGRIKEIGQVEQVSDKFRKLAFLLTVIDKEYEIIYPFQLTQSRTDILNNSKAGDDVKVSFTIRANEWKGKHYVNLDAHAVENLINAVPKEEVRMSQRAKPITPQPDLPVSDNLPF